MMVRFFLRILEKALNQALQLDPHYREHLVSLVDKTILFELDGLPFFYYVHFESDQLRLMTKITGEPDAILRGTPFALFKSAVVSRFSSSINPAELGREIEMEGDVRLGTEVVALIQSLDFDWEGHFSHFFGDVFAHTVVKNAKRGIHYLDETKDRLTEQFKEYLQSEAEYVPPAAEVDTLYDEIQSVQMAVDRLEARLNRLEQSREE